MLDLPNLPHESAADGMLEEDAQLHDMSSRPKPEFDFEPRDHIDLAGPMIDIGARRAHVRLALRLPARRHRPPARRDRAVRARQARGKGFTPVMTPVLVREEALVGTRLLPRGARAGLRRRERRSRAVPDRHLGGRAGRPAHGRDPAPRPTSRCATAASRRASGARPARRARTRAASSARTSSTRSRCSRSAIPTARGTSTSCLLSIEREIADDSGLHYRVMNIAVGRPRRAGRQEVRHRGLAAGPGPLPRAHVVLEHDRLPGAQARRALPRARRACATCTRSTAPRSPRRARSSRCSRRTSAATAA